MVEVINIVGGALLLLTSILIIAAVLMQESRQTGLSGTVTGGSSDSYLGKNKSRTMDAKLARLTKVCAVIFFILTIAVNLVGVFVA